MPDPSADCPPEEPREVGCIQLHACLPAECLEACRIGAGTDSVAEECMSACVDDETARTTRWRCGGGPSGPLCEALSCAAGSRLEFGRCVADVEICNNGIDDDGDGLIDGTLLGDDPCAATIDTRGSEYQFGSCTVAGDERCDDHERVGLHGEERCYGSDCPFMVELTYAYALDREEVSFRAFRECVESGCCAELRGRIGYLLGLSTPPGSQPPPRPDPPLRCMPPPVIAPLGVDPLSPGMPEGAVGTDDPILLDLPVASVPWPGLRQPPRVRPELLRRGGPERTEGCPDPREDYCGTGVLPACGAYLVKRLVIDGTALLEFVPRALIAALGVDPDQLEGGRLDDTVDSLLRTSLGPLGGDSLFIVEIPEDLGQVDGELPGRIGPGYIDGEGILSYAGLREGDSCVPADLPTVVFRSERGSIDVRAVCDQSPFDVFLPEAARTIRVSMFWIEAERTRVGIEGSALGMLTLEDADLWTIGSPPVPDIGSVAESGSPLLSLCEFFDVLGCDQKPPGCPEGHLEPCPADSRQCNGYLFPMRLSMVRADEAGIPGLRVCEE